MNPLYLLAIPAIALIGFGILAVFKVAQAPGTVVKLPFGIEVSSGVPGLVMIAIGAGMLYPPVITVINAKPTITDVRLTTDTGQDSGEWNVRCPIAIRLKGTISVGTKGGTVSYRFVRTTGGPGAPEEPGPVRQLSFQSPSTAEVADSVNVVIPEGVVQFEELIEIVEPDTRRSPPVRVTVTCNPNLPPGPDTLPPDVQPPSP